MKLLILNIIILICILLFYYEKDHLFYYLSCSNNKNITGLPTPSQCKDKIISLLRTLSQNSYTLIDFGCGDGDIIESFYPYVHHVIGIEIDEKQAISTKKRFSEIKSVTILNMNMKEYQFSNIPTILYMYEPLWFYKKEDALKLYHHVIKEFMEKTNQDSFIIYVSGIYDLLDSSVFELYHLQEIHHSRVSRFLGWNGNHLYIYKKI
jgi:hypothetical protein